MLLWYMVVCVQPKMPYIGCRLDAMAESGSFTELQQRESTSMSEFETGSTPFIEKTGFLYKMGGNWPSWKLRYFVLRPGIFSYYKKNNTSTKPLGVVKLKNLKIFFPGVGERKLSFQFTVHTESSWNKRNDWVMASQSEREMKEWIAAFKLADMKVSPPSSDKKTEVAATS